jgi:hypothetical protein
MKEKKRIMYICPSFYRINFFRTHYNTRTSRDLEVKKVVGKRRFTGESKGIMKNLFFISMITIKDKNSNPHSTTKKKGK